MTRSFAIAFCIGGAWSAAIANPRARLTARQDASAAAPAPSASAVPAEAAEVAEATTDTVDLVPVAAVTNAATLTVDGCSFVTEPPATLTYTNYGTVSEEDEVVTTVIPEGVGCRCGDSLMAGLSMTIGDNGVKSYYCATGGAQNPISVAAPTGTPGDPMNEQWADVTCDYGSLDSVDNDPWLQWNDSGASAAYNDAKEAYGLELEQDSFPDFLADFFHARPDISCELLDNPNCEVTINCGQGLNEPNAAVSSPAGYVVINSMVSLHMIFDNIWNGINDALPMVLSEVGTFVDSLSPIVDDISEQQQTKLILDGIQAALFMVMAPVFHSGLARLAWVKANPNWVAAGFDVSYGIIGTSFAAAKDAMESLSPLPVQNTIDKYVGDTANRWLEGVAGMAKNVFNDPDRLGFTIDMGKTFGADIDDDPYDVLNIMKKTLLASALRPVWMSGEDVAYPVILTKTNIEQEGTGCESYDPNKYDSGEEIILMIEDEEVVTASRMCDGDEAYWVVAANPKKEKVFCCTGPENGDVCDMCESSTITVSTLRGWDTIDGKNWGGLSKEEVFYNALNLWKKNGLRNSFSSAFDSLETQQDLENLVSADLGKTYGIVNIPVCDWQQIVDTALDDPDNTKDNKNYPCPP